MKTKNMRKKALVSSLAMLLVAVVALSGATYAWFSANSAAKVSGVKLTASTSSSLLFADDTDSTDWTANYDLDADDQTLVPMSTTDGTNFYVATAGTTGSAGSTVVASIDDASSGDRFSQDLAVRAGTDCGLLLKTITAGDLAGALRVMITIDGTNYIFSPVAESNPKAIKPLAEGATDYEENSATYDKFYAGTDAAVTSRVGAVTLRQPSSSTAFVNLDEGTPTAMTITVWLEGNDNSCNDNMATKVLSDLQIEFGVGNKIT